MCTKFMCYPRDINPFAGYPTGVTGVTGQSPHVLDFCVPLSCANWVCRKKVFGRQGLACVIFAIFVLFRSLRLRLALPATEVPKPQTPKSARGGVWGSAGRKWGARESAPESARESGREGARESARPPFACAKRGRALSQAPSQAPSEHSPEHFPQHPTSGRHSPKHSPKHLPEHFWGFGASAPL